MANYQNQYAATPQIVDPSYPLSQIDEAPQLDAADAGKSEAKGLKEKMKEKLPGHRKDNPSATTGEKKGIMEKVREKLPGLHH